METNLKKMKKDKRISRFFLANLIGDFSSCLISFLFETETEEEK